MSLKRRGTQIERELQKKLWKDGIICIRVAGSGSSRYPAPDLIAFYKEKIFILEIKSTIQDYIYIRSTQIKDLEYLNKKINCHVFFGFKFIKTKEWIFITLKNLKDIISSSGRVDYKDLKNKGIGYKEFINFIKSKNIFN